MWSAVSSLLGAPTTTGTTPGTSTSPSPRLAPHALVATDSSESLPGTAVPMSPNDDDDDNVAVPETPSGHEDADGEMSSPEEDFAAGKALFEKGEWEKAAGKLLRASEHGHAEAMKYLSDCYTSDRLSNPTLHTTWSTRHTVLLSTPDGMCAHAHTLRAASDHVGATTWFRRAAEAGSPEAMHQLGLYLRKLGAGRESVGWFERAAEAGFAPAEVALAEVYEMGIEDGEEGPGSGVARDPGKAAEWRQRIFRREAEALRREGGAGKMEAAAAKAAVAAQRRLSGKAGGVVLGVAGPLVDDVVASPTSPDPDGVPSVASRPGGLLSTLLGGSAPPGTSSADKEFKEAQRLLEWGSWAKAIKLLDRLTPHHDPAAAMLDPGRTSLKNPTGMLWMSAHFAERSFAAGGGGGAEAEADKMLAAAWYAAAVARASKLAAVPPPTTPSFLSSLASSLTGGSTTATTTTPTTAAFLLSIPLAVPAEIEPIIARVVPDAAARRRAVQLDRDFKDSLSQLEWGNWQKGFEGLEALASRPDDPHEAAKAYLDPTRTPIKNPTGLAWMAERFEARAAAAEFQGKPEAEREAAGLRETAAAWRKRAEDARKKLGGASLFGDPAPPFPAMPSADAPKPLPAPPTAAAPAATPTVQDAQHRTALSSLAWGSYDKGASLLLDLADASHGPSQAYLDPTASPLRDPAAMHALATHIERRALADGGDPARLDAAAGWYRKAADAGHHRAMVRYAKLLAEEKLRPGGCGRASGVKSRDRWQAVAWCMRAWDVGGNGEAAYEMAVAYARGVEVEDEVSAGAAGGSPSAAPAASAKRQTGVMPKAKLIDLEEAAAAGAAGASIQAPSLLDQEVPSSLVDAVDVLAASGAPETGLVPATSGAASLDPLEQPSADATPAQSSPEPGATASPGPKKKKKKKTVIVKKDEVKAAEWAKRSAGKEFPAGINLLGEMMLEGKGGVPANKPGAVQNFRKAAQLGDPVAMFNLGTCLLHGVGTDADETQALLWLTRATAAAKQNGAAATSS
ncbi:hypothetical protein HDU96_010253 [Phlyctochytrium bullatum]|nr:hypothetical protein HDU96_010253 [Phlyctochytrium bullatum]